MPRFKNGDRVQIVPKFADIYPGRSGVIVDVITDPFRPVFTEYIVLLGDGSKAALFEFQLLEDRPGYRLAIAELILDTSRQTDDPKSQGRPLDRRIVLQAERIIIDMSITRTPTYASIVGHLFE